MDNNDRKGQNESPYPAQSHRFNTNPAHDRGLSSSRADRFRPAPLTASPSASGRGATAYPGGYYQEPGPSFANPIPTNPLPYQPSSYDQDHQRQQQSFPPYHQEVMYDVAQPPPQTSVYDSNQQFQARQPAGMQMLSDVAAPYFAHEPTSAPVPPGLQHHASSGPSTVYQHHQQSPADRAPLLAQAYPGNMAMGEMPHAAAGVMGEGGFPGQQPGTVEAYTLYQTTLKETFQNIIDGRLREASVSLMEASTWLLGRVRELGLTSDEKSLHNERLRLWGEFNTAWLSIFQRQQDMLESRQRIQAPQSLMTQAYINRMAKDLIRLCDAIEKDGLVDYQYGVAEEQIITAALTECLDLQESIQGRNDEGPDDAQP
ncbi:hypothetical protein B7494_g1270 [Chlorociboria aeruginascens]|nr:hypothetical protein B7494_g1270 [Chlorociboria aeruginascens]